MTLITDSLVRRAREQEYGEKITVEKEGEVILPNDFDLSRFPKSLPLGAQAVYRDSRATDSVQIRVFEDKVTLQLDRYNPEYRPVPHALTDARKYTAGAALVAIAAFGGS